jgi:rhodanese-related sulfurtransferase
MSAVLFGRRIETLAPAEAWNAHRQKGLVLVDVRQRSEWCSGVVLGALRIPLQELNRRIGELPREGTVVFLCGSGHRSLLAAYEAQLGGIDAARVDGGILAWRDAELPTSTSAREDEAA